MTTGAGDKKQVAILCALGTLAAYLLYANVLTGPDGRQPVAHAARQVPPGAPAPPGGDPAARSWERTRMRRASQGSGQFHPVLRSKRAEDRIDPMSVDPTLRLDLFAKLQSQSSAAGSRNLFQFWQPPQTKPPAKPEPPIMPAPPVTAAAPPPPPPAPLPITFKYYGYSTASDNGRKTAFFLDGDQIMAAAEGGTVKRRYRVIRIGAKSVVVEDVESKRQQPVALAEEAGG